jgi:Zn-dependent protease
MIVVSWIFWVIFSITLHELGHGWAAIRVGDRTPIDLGHMTWNPYIHMGPMGLLMFALFGFTWGLMPVDPSRFRGRYADAYVAFAGPVMNISLGLVCLLLILPWMKYATSLDSTLHHNVFLFLHVGLAINLMGFVFNLIPIPPLDGSTILASFVHEYRRFIRSQEGALASLIGFGILFAVGGRYIWPFVFGISDFLVEQGLRVLP